jgi:hypothetical protein
VRSDRHVVSLNAWTRLGVLADLRFAWPPGAPPGARGELAWGYHLVWVDNEHATDRSAALPRITARLLAAPGASPEDTAIQQKLATDPGGPVGLFRGRWLEARGAFSPPPSASGPTAQLGL